MTKLLNSVLEKIKVALKNNSSVLKNLLWILSEKALRIGLGFFVIGLTARYLGPEKFGTLSYCLAITVMFSAFSILGLNGVTVKELVANPQKKTEIIATCFFLRILGGVLVLFFSICAVLYFRSGDSISLLLVLLFSLSWLFKSSESIKYYFESQLLSKYVAISESTGFVFGSLFKICMVWVGAGLIIFAIANIVEALVIAITLIFFSRKLGTTVSFMEFSFERAKSLLSSSWPLILSGLSIAMYMKIDQIMIGNMLGDKDVGTYTSATILSEVWYFIPVALATSIFPSLLEAQRKDDDYYFKFLERWSHIMVAGSILLAVTVSIAANPLIHIVFGKEYEGAAGVLVIHIWAIVFVSLGLINDKWIISEEKTYISLVLTFAGLAFNVASNYILIPKLGIEGAAIGTLIAQALPLLIILPLFKGRAFALWKINISSLFLKNYFLLFHKKILLVNKISAPK